MTVNDVVSPWGNGSTPVPLPWHSGLVDSLAKQVETQRLGHAYLLAGMQGCGIEQFALAISAGLLCERAGVVACGTCPSCHIVQSGAHPDFHFIGLDDASVIKVDQIRRAIHFASETAARSGYRCIVISPAEAMNVNAANALLKLLEEPGQKTVLWLVSYSPAALLPTIASRCQKLTMAQVETTASRSWLTECGVDEAYFDPFYLARPVQAWVESRSQAPASYLLVKQQFLECIAKRQTVEEFVKQTSKVDAIALVDHLYMLCVDFIKQHPTLIAKPEVNTAINELTRVKRALLRGSTENLSLFYQTWWQQWLCHI